LSAAPIDDAAIEEIVNDRGKSSNTHKEHRVIRRSGVLHVVCVVGALLMVSSTAEAERISLMTFEGSNARALRWRVAGALKRSGHTVIGVAPPKNPSEAKLRAFAKRRRVDLFVAGSSVQGSDGFELTLTVRDPDGAEVGQGVTINAPSYRAMLKELREDGASQIESALRGDSPKASKRRQPAADTEIDVDSDAEEEPAPRQRPRPAETEIDADSDADAPPAAGDFAGAVRAQAKKKRRGELKAIDLDGDGSSSAESEPAGSSSSADGEGEGASDDAASSESEEGSEGSGDRASKASGWSSSDSTPSEDDGRASFLGTDDSESGDGSAVGEDSGAESSADAQESALFPTVVLGLNAGFVRRTLEYSDNLYGRLRAPSANSWVYRLQAAVYPFAKPVKNRIGLIAGYESEFSGVVRDNRAGTDFGVTFSEVYGGVKLRQPLGKHDLSLEGTIGSMQAGLDDPEGASRVPQFSYTSLRGALSAGLHFGALGMRGSLGYRLPIGGFGEASEVDWFPRMEGSGIEGSLGLEYRISKEVAFDTSATMRRYLLQMNSRPADALDGTSEVAGGAVDLYLGGYFGLNITL
jgi:hypothetical protein